MSATGIVPEDPFIPGIVPKDPFIPLTQKGGRVVHARAFAGDWEGTIVSITFTTEWLPGSGTKGEFPEIDRAEFFDVPVAKRKVKAAQAALIDELDQVVTERG
jgi:predicted NUDIX family NTP pyrophosphohydrolase